MGLILEVLGTARDLGRVQEIASVLIRHGLGDTVRRLGLAGMLERTGEMLHWDAAKGISSTTPEQRVRCALEDLGPTFVKLGQLLAGRKDLLPPALTTELALLQQHARPVPFDEILPQLEEDLGAEPEGRFAHFEREPLAAASIAQVHRARTHSGREVVVKIRRPGIHEVVDKDLRLLARLAELAEEEMPELRRYRPVSVVREFARTLRGELDLGREVRNVERIGAKMQPAERIDVPVIEEEFTCERLMVMSFFDGPSVGDWIRAGKPGDADASDLAARGADAFLRMVFVDGLYHADPHAGNLVLLEDGRLGLLDFGMVGRITEARRIEFLGLLMAVVDHRDEELADLLLDWSHDGNTNADQLREDCARMVDRYADLSLNELDVTAALGDLTELLRENDLYLPGDVSMLMRVLMLLDGLGRGLDPNFVMATRVEPFARRQLLKLRSPFRAVRSGMRDIGQLLFTLPRDLKRLLRAARRGKLEVEIEVKRLEAFGHQLDRSANRITVGLVTAALIVGTSIALTVDGGPKLFGLPLFGFVGFFSSSMAGFWLLWSIWRSGRSSA